MPRELIHADLLVKGFPFNSEALGSTVIINRGYELNRTPFVARGEDFDSASGIPQCYYMQNVFPTSRGYASAHFAEGISAHPFGS